MDHRSIIIGNFTSLPTFLTQKLYPHWIFSNKMEKVDCLSNGCEIKQIEELIYPIFAIDHSFPPPKI